MIMRISCWLPAPDEDPQPDGETPNVENAGASTIANVDNN
jgi:hypothetical protein